MMNLCELVSHESLVVIVAVVVVVVVVDKSNYSSFFIMVFTVVYLFTDINQKIKRMSKRTNERMDEW